MNVQSPAFVDRQSLIVKTYLVVTDVDMILVLVVIRENKMENAKVADLINAYGVQDFKVNLQL